MLLHFFTKASLPHPFSGDTFFMKRFMERVLSPKASSRLPLPNPSFPPDPSQGKSKGEESEEYPLEKEIQEIFDEIPKGEYVVVDLRYNRPGEKILKSLDIDSGHKQIFFKDESGKMVPMGHLTSKPFGESLKLPIHPDKPQQENNWVPATHLENSLEPGHLEYITQQISSPPFPSKHPSIQGKVDVSLSSHINQNQRARDILETKRSQLKESDAQRNLEGSPRERRPRYRPQEEENDTD